MKNIYLIILLILLPQPLLSYENSMLNLEVPTNLEEGQSEFNVQHRFYGKIDEEPLDTFLGLDLGANVSLGLRHLVRPQFEANVSYTRNQKEYIVGASYAYFFPEIFLRSQLDIQFFSYKKLGIDERRQNIFYQIVLQSEPLSKRFTPVINAGYDGYNQRFGLGLGTGVSILEDLSIMGEYFPVLDRNDDDLNKGIIGQKNRFALGIMLKTYGHHFIFILGNGTEIGTRRLMLGTQSNDLHLGFNIQRLLE